MIKHIVAVVAAALTMVCASAAWAQDGRWWRAESPQFIVYGDGGERQVRDAARALEDFDTVLRILTNPQTAPSANKLEIYLVRNQSGLREVSPRLGEDVYGFYSAGMEQIAAFVVDDRDMGGVRNQLLFHEYAHHFMLHYFPHAYPRWYVEGWAEFVSTTEFRVREARVGQSSEMRAPWLQADLLPIEHLLRPERYARTTEFEMRFYALSWLAAIYLSNTPERQRGLVRYVAALSDGADPMEAFEPAFGITPEAFERELRSFRRGRISILGIALPEARAEVTVTRLPIAADDLLLPLARLRREGSFVDEGDFTAQVERLAQRHAGAPMAQIALARAAMAREDYPAARTTLEAMLASGSDDAEARYLLANTMLLNARDIEDYAEARTIIAEARRQLVAGFRAHPDHYPTLYLYAMTFSGGPDPLTEAQLNVLDRALDLAPQSADIRLNFARELMRASEFETAELVLQPLIYAPHHPSAAQRARILVEAARNRAQPPRFIESREEADE